MSLSDFLAKRLPTKDEIDAERRAVPNWKPPTRVEDMITERALTVVDDRQFKKEVWKRDGYRCRCCGRPVVRTPARIPERGEVHHVHGRGGDLRFEVRAALLLCLKCHERVTGRVNDRLAIIGSKFFTVRGERYIDARAPVRFEKIV